MARYKPVFTNAARKTLSQIYKDAWARGRGETPSGRRMRFNPSKRKK